MALLVFFHIIFSFSFSVRPNTCSNAMILYPKANSIFLNTFPTIFWCQNHFYNLSASRNQNCSLKNHEKTHEKSCFFRDFLVNNFNFETLRVRKIEFSTETVFSNIELSLGYNIMISEQALGRI